MSSETEKNSERVSAKFCFGFGLVFVLLCVCEREFSVIPSENRGT